MDGLFEIIETNKFLSVVLSVNVKQ